MSGRKSSKKKRSHGSNGVGSTTASAFGLSGSKLGRPKPAGASRALRPRPATESPDALETIVRRWYTELWDQNRLEVIDELFATNGSNYEPDRPAIRGRQNFKEFVREIRTAFPDLQVAVENIVISGYHAAVRWRARMTPTGQYLSNKPSGIKSHTEGVSFYTIRDGLIYEIGNVRGQTLPLNGSVPSSLASQLSNSGVEVVKPRRGRPPASPQSCPDRTNSNCPELSQKCANQSDADSCYYHRACQTDKKWLDPSAAKGAHIRV